MFRVEASGAEFESVHLYGSHWLGSCSCQKQTSPPYDFAVDIPIDERPGTYTFHADGQMQSGRTANSAEVAIHVLPTGMPWQLTWNRESLSYLLAHPAYMLAGLASALLLAFACAFVWTRATQPRYWLPALLAGPLAPLPLQVFLYNHPYGFFDYPARSSIHWDFSELVWKSLVWPLLAALYAYLVSRPDASAPGSKSPAAASTVLTGIKLLIVAALFALTGAWSAWLCEGTITPSENLLFVTIPFSVLAPVLLLRSWKALVAIPLFGLDWVVAYQSAHFWILLPVAGMIPVELLAGGFVGGIGLALACSVGHCNMLHWRLWTTAGFVGAASALPFKYYYFDRGSNSWDFSPLAISFAVWQVLTGCYLFWACDSARRDSGGRGAARRED